MTRTSAMHDMDGDDAWDEHARLWDTDEQARTLADRALEGIWQQLGPESSLRGARVLDFGCGTGLLAQRLAPWVTDLVAVDVDSAMLRLVVDKQLSNVKARRIDITIESLPDSWTARFDLVVASYVCGVLPSYASTLGKLAGALKPGGMWMQWDWLLPDPATEDDDGLTLDEVRAAMRQAELTPLRVQRTLDAPYGDEMLIGVAQAR